MGLGLGLASDSRDGIWCPWYHLEPRRTGLAPAMAACGRNDVKVSRWLPGQLHFVPADRDTRTGARPLLRALRATHSGFLSLHVPLDYRAEPAERGPLNRRDRHAGRYLEGDRARHHLARRHVDRAVVEVGVAGHAVRIRRIVPPVGADQHGIGDGVLALRAAGQALDREDEPDEPLSAGGRAE